MKRWMCAIGISMGLYVSLPLPLHASAGAEYVYVESNVNTPNGNSIYAFKRDVDGRLHAVTGSPFVTGGTGVTYTGYSIGPYDSDQEVVVNAAQTQLFAVNTGSNTIAVFNIEEGGALSPVEGSPFPSGGASPVSLGLRGNILYIANQGGTLGIPL